MWKPEGEAVCSNVNTRNLLFAAWLLRITTEIAGIIIQWCVKNGDRQRRTPWLLVSGQTNNNQIVSRRHSTRPTTIESVHLERMGYILSKISLCDPPGNWFYTVNNSSIRSVNFGTAWSLNGNQGVDCWAHSLSRPAPILLQAPAIRLQRPRFYTEGFSPYFTMHAFQASKISSYWVPKKPKRNEI